MKLGCWELAHCWPVRAPAVQALLMRRGSFQGNPIDVAWSLAAWPETLSQ